MLQYLSCLTTSRSLTDKLAFDVGLQEDSTGGFECYYSISLTYTSLDVCILNQFVHHRRGLLVDHTSSLQAKVWGWEGQSGRWPHSRQCFFRAIPGKMNVLLVCLRLWLIFCQHDHLYSPQHLSYASGDLMVDASFMQTLWTMTPVMSGCELAEGV